MVIYSVNGRGEIMFSLYFLALYLIYFFIYIVKEHSE
jgi:hypothetical protein